MGAPLGSKNALGNKGGGRKSLVDELLRKAVIEKAWGKLLKKIDLLDDKEIKDICLPIVLKNMPHLLNASVKSKIMVETSEAVAQKNKLINDDINTSTKSDSEGFTQISSNELREEIRQDDLSG